MSALIALALCALASPALAWGPWPFVVYRGGVLLCNEYGCRGSPYLPVPPVQVPPAVVYSPLPNGPGPGARPRSVSPGPPYIPPPARALPQAPAKAPSLSKREATERGEIERDILTFCEGHPSEPFCVRLGTWLREHPDGKAP